MGSIINYRMGVICLKYMVSGQEGFVNFRRPGSNLQNPFISSPQVSDSLICCPMAGKGQSADMIIPYNDAIR